MKITSFISTILLFVCIIATILPAQVDKKREPSKSRLMLSDVLVYGLDTQVRVSGSKLSISGDKARLIQLSSAYQPFSFQTEINSQKEYIQSSERSLDTINKYLLGYGSYNEVHVSLLRWQKIHLLNYTIGGKFHRSDGQYDNSQFRSGAFNGQFSYLARSRLRFQMDTDYALRDYFLQGSLFQGHERKMRSFALKMGSYFRDVKNTYGSFNVHYDAFNLSNEVTSETFASDVQEQTFVLTGQTFWALSNVQLSLKGSFLRNNLHSGEVQEKTDYISYLQAKGRYKYGSNLSFTFGIQLNNVSIETQDPETDIMPFGKVTYSQKNKWGFYIAGSHEYIYQTFQNLWRTNYFVADSLDRLAQNVQYKIDIGTEFKFKEEWTAKANWKFKQIKHFAYFERTLNEDGAIADGLFGYYYLDRVKRMDIALTTDFALTPQFIFTTNLNYVSFKVEDDSVKNTDNKIPYLENLNSELKLTYKFSDATKVALSTKYVGSRRKHLEQTGSLAGHLLINLDFEKQYNRYVVLFINANNLSNQKYQIWDGYRELGINVMGGIKGKW